MVAGSMVEVVVQRNGIVVVGVEHRVDGRKSRAMVGVARKTDEDDQVVVAAMVELAVGRPSDRLDMLLALLTPLHVGFLGNLHVWLETYRCRVDRVNTERRGHHLALTVVHGIAVVAIFVFHEGEAIGVMYIIVELIARGKTFDDLAVGLGEAHGDVL